MVILKKIFGLAIIGALTMILQYNSCYASPPLSMEIMQIEIARNAGDIYRISSGILRTHHENPRIKIDIELINNSMDSVLFHGSNFSDRFKVTYEYKGKQYSQDMSIIPVYHRNEGFYRIPPDEAEMVSMKFDPELLKDENHPLNSSGYAQMLWDILPTISVTYTRWEKVRGYGKSDPISASWGDGEDIIIKKVPKENIK